MQRRTIVVQRRDPRRPPIHPVRRPSRPPRRFWPYYSRFPVGEGPLKDAVRDTRKPFLAMAGLLGTGGLLGSLPNWSRIRPVLDETGVMEWLQSEAVLLLYIGVLSVLAFLLLTLLLMRLLEGWWMFSIARNMVVTAAFCFVVLLFRFFPEHAFAGFGLVALSLALLVSYLGAGFPKVYWRLRSYGDVALEMILLAPFLALLWPVYETTPHVRLAWEASRRLWRAVVA